MFQFECFTIIHCNSFGPHQWSPFCFQVTVFDGKIFKSQSFLFSLNKKERVNNCCYLLLLISQKVNHFVIHFSFWFFKYSRKCKIQQFLKIFVIAILKPNKQCLRLPANFCSVDRLSKLLLFVLSISAP